MCVCVCVCVCENSYLVNSPCGKFIACKLFGGGGNSEFMIVKNLFKKVKSLVLLLGLGKPLFIKAIDLIR